MEMYMLAVGGIVVVLGVLAAFAVRASRRDRATYQQGPAALPPDPHRIADDPRGAYRPPQHADSNSAVTRPEPSGRIGRGSTTMRDPAGDRGERAAAHRRRDERIDDGLDAAATGALAYDAADDRHDGQSSYVDGGASLDGQPWFQPFVQPTRHPDWGTAADPYGGSGTVSTPDSGPSYSDPGPSSSPDPGPLSSPSGSSSDSGGSSGGGDGGGGGSF